MPSILDDFSLSQQPVAPDVTLATKIHQEADAIKAATQNLLKTIINQRNGIYAKFWRTGAVPQMGSGGVQGMLSNDAKITPPRIAAALGAEAHSLFVIDVMLKGFITQLATNLGFALKAEDAKPNQPVLIIEEVLPGQPADWDVKDNGDGTVTITTVEPVL